MPCRIFVCVCVKYSQLMEKVVLAKCFELNTVESMPPAMCCVRKIMFRSSTLTRLFWFLKVLVFNFAVCIWADMLVKLYV